MADGVTVTGDTLRLGSGSSVGDVFANTLQIDPDALVRGSIGIPTLPVISPFCEVPHVACGATDVRVAPGQSLGPLAPGTYGRLRVLNGGLLTLQPGAFVFCDIKAGRGATIRTLGQATLDVAAGKVTIGTGSFLGPTQGTDPILVNVAGRSVRVSASAVANAVFVAPNANMSFGRGARLVGCFCTHRAKSDKGITLQCPAP